MIQDHVVGLSILILTNAKHFDVLVLFSYFFSNLLTKTNISQHTFNIDICQTEDIIDLSLMH